MASIQYTAFPTSYKKLGDEINRVVDLYQVNALPEEDLREMIASWKSNVPDLLFASKDHMMIAESLVRNIGKKRARIIQWAAMEK